MSEWRKIFLTQGKFTLVDAIDFERVSQHKWYFVAPCNGLDLKNGGYAARKVGGRRQMLHRFLLKPRKGFVVDHINKNGLDNRRKNIRAVTHAVNMENSRPRSSTGYKGVYWSEKRKRFHVQVCINSKLKTIGFFKTAKEGALAWNKSIKKNRKDNVFLNKICQSG